MFTQLSTFKYTSHTTMPLYVVARLPSSRLCNPCATLQRNVISTNYVI